MKLHLVCEDLHRSSLYAQKFLSFVSKDILLHTGSSLRFYDAQEYELTRRESRLPVDSHSISAGGWQLSYSVSEKAPMGNRFPKNSIISDGTAANVGVSANKLVSCKEKEVICTKMTSRIAIRGLNWSHTSVTDVFQVFASMLQDPSELLSIKLYRWKGHKPNKTYLFGVADFRSGESAKTAFEKINSVELNEKSGVFILEVIPDDMTFEDPVDVCTKCNLGQPENSVREKSGCK